MRLRTRALALSLLALCLANSSASAQTERARVVRLAEIEIDPQQISAYLAALREEITASVRLEPGVLSLSAVSVKDHPEQIRIFEIYADPTAYEDHLQSPHFKKYKAATQGMVKSLHLIETEPVILRAK